MIGLGELGVIAITALQYGYPAFMTIDLGAIALSMMKVEGWGEQIHSVRAGWNMADRIKPLMGCALGRGTGQAARCLAEGTKIEPIRQGQNSWYEVLADLQKVFC